MLKFSRTGWVVLSCAWLLGFVTWGSAIIVSPILGVIKTDLFLTYSQAGLLFSLPMIVASLFAIPGGLLADRVGVRVAAGMGAILVGIGGFLRGASADYLMLLFFTSVFGVGWGFIMPNLPKLVSCWFSKKFFGRATGIYSTGVAAGAFFTLAIAAPIYSATGSWQGVFFIWATVAFAIATVWWVLVRDPASCGPTYSGGSKDLSAKLTYTVWKNKDVWLCAFLFFGSVMLYYSLIAWLPSILLEAGVSFQSATLTTSLIPLFSMLGMGVSPLLSDKLGRRKPFLWISFLVCTVILLTLWYVPADHQWFLISILGFMTGTQFALCLTVTTEIVESRFVGSASGVVLSVGYVGVVGSWMTGYILDFSTFFYALVMLSMVSIALMILGLLLPESAHPSRLHNPPPRQDSEH